MIDHVSIAVSDLVTSAAQYERVLAPLGLTRLAERPGRVGFGKRYPEFWLNERTNLTQRAEDPGQHVAIRAPDETSVRAFHAIARAMGWVDAGSPGLRQATVSENFAAFVRDQDGNKIEALTFPRQSPPSAA
jgi:catechol 2,3-dioxygenase-like lactoylglutathione lyase family enzyme